VFGYPPLLLSSLVGESSRGGDFEEVGGFLGDECEKLFGLTGSS
jgi:hypothetical protein